MNDGEIYQQYLFVLIKRGRWFWYSLIALHLIEIAIILQAPTNVLDRFTWLAQPIKDLNPHIPSLTNYDRVAKHPQVTALINLLTLATLPLKVLLTTCILWALYPELIAQKWFPAFRLADRRITFAVPMAAVGLALGWWWVDQCIYAGEYIARGGTPSFGGYRTARIENWIVYGQSVTQLNTIQLSNLYFCALPLAFAVCCVLRFNLRFLRVTNSKPEEF